MIVTKRIGFPVVVGQILVGILLSPSVLDWVKSSHTLEFLSEIGVILLMFLAGLESNLSLLRKHLRPSLIIAVLGVLTPLLAFLAMMLGMGQSFSVAWFYGLVFAATSVSITVEVLREEGQLSSKAGSIILGAAIVDDILAVLLVSFSVSEAGSTGEILTKLGLQVLFFAFLFLVYKWTPRLFQFADHLPVYMKFSILSLILCFSLALVADAVGMSAVIGSFFAGVTISQTHVAEKVENYLSSFAYVMFIPIFFVSIALSVRFDGLLDRWLMILILSVLAILTKFLPSILAGKIFKLSNSESSLIGAGMISRGEMALIILQIGLTSKILTTDIFSELVLVVILTTLFAPLLIKYILKIEKR